MSNQKFKGIGKIKIDMSNMESKDKTNRICYYINLKSDTFQHQIISSSKIVFKFQKECSNVHQRKEIFGSAIATWLIGNFLKSMP